MSRKGHAQLQDVPHSREPKVIDSSQIFTIHDSFPIPDTIYQCVDAREPFLPQAVLPGNIYGIIPSSGF